MGYSNQKRYAQRNDLDRGLIKVCIWIPLEDRERVIRMADKLRAQARNAAAKIGIAPGR